jgi:hypothetical protein
VQAACGVAWCKQRATWAGASSERRGLVAAVAVRSRHQQWSGASAGSANSERRGRPQANSELVHALTCHSDHRHTFGPATHHPSGQRTSSLPPPLPPLPPQAHVAVTSTLSGFTSRWMMPRACRWATAVITSANIRSRRTRDRRMPVSRHRLITLCEGGGGSGVAHRSRACRRRAPHRQRPVLAQLKPAGTRTAAPGRGAE